MEGSVPWTSTVAGVPRLSPRVVVSIAYVAAMFVTIVDTTIVHVALPTLADEFGVGIGSIEWVVTGYLLSLAVWIPASGWIGDHLGTKRTFLAALAVFTIASLLCGLSTSLGELIAFRILQGVGGGMLTPVGLAMLYRAFPPERRAAASKVLLVPTAIAPALGPVAGGVLIETVGWRWIFLVNIPIGVATFLFAARYLEEHREPDTGAFDVPGFVLAGAALALILFAMGEGPRAGWGAPLTLLTGLAGIACAIALVAVELRTHQPMLTLGLLGNRLFRTTNGVSMFASAAFLGTLFLMPLLLQEVRGASPIESGLTTFPEALGVLALSQLAGRIYPRLGPRVLMAGGLTSMAVILVALSRVGLGTSDWVIRSAMFGLGASYAFMLLSMQAACFATIPSSQTGRATALYSTQRQIAQALGIAVLATVLAASLPEHATPAGSLGSYHTAILVAAGFAVAGALTALAVPVDDARVTMVAHRPRAAVVD